MYQEEDILYIQLNPNLFMATGAHGNPRAGAAGLVVEAHRNGLGGATILLLVEEAQGAVGRIPRPRGATPKHVQLQLLQLLLLHLHQSK